MQARLGHAPHRIPHRIPHLSQPAFPATAGRSHLHVAWVSERFLLSDDVTARKHKQFCNHAEDLPPKPPPPPPGAEMAAAVFDEATGKYVEAEAKAAAKAKKAAAAAAARLPAAGAEAFVPPDCLEVEQVPAART